jgi:hypothetical protein
MALIDLPCTIALVREIGEGATFCAPLEEGAVRIGDLVDVSVKRWDVGGEEGEFTGIVVGHAAATKSTIAGDDNGH